MCARNIRIFPSLKAGGRFWPCLLPSFAHAEIFLVRLEMVFTFSCCQGQVFPICSSAERVSLPVLASLHIWSQHWGIFSCDWRDPECTGRSLFFFQRGKIFKTSHFAFWVGVGENQMCLSYSLALAAKVILVLVKSYKSFSLAWLGVLRLLMSPQAKTQFYRLCVKRLSLEVSGHLDN